MKTKEEMIKVIYEKVADKTLSFGCYVKNLTHHKYNKAIYCYKWWQKEHFVYQRDNWEIDKWWAWYFDFEIIWHPVMIWDILDYWLNKKTFSYNEYFAMYWNNWRKPIEEQSDECIKYVYNLINK